MVGMAFSIGSPFRPALPSPYRSTFIGVADVIVIPVTRDCTATPAAIDVSPDVVVAVPPRVKMLALAKENRPLGVGYDAAASAGAPPPVCSVCALHVTFSWAIWLSLHENSQPMIFTPVNVCGCTVIPEICGRPTWMVWNRPAFDPLVWSCLYAVPSTKVGVVTA